MTGSVAAEFAGWLESEAGFLHRYRSRSYASVGDQMEHLRGFQQALFDAGWTRRGWPESMGGTGGDAAERGVIYDLVYAAGLDLPRGLELVEVIGPALVAFAPEIARAELPALIRGDLISCQGFSEPEAGSDLAALRTRARPDGAGFRLTGQKTWISLGHVADRGLVLARTGDQDSRHRGITAFWLDLHTEGVTTRPIAFADGRDELTEVFLSDVPAGRVIGEVNKGWEVAMFLLQFERGNYAWQRQAWLSAILGRALTAGSTASIDVGAVGQAWLDLVALRAGARTTVRQLAAGERPGARTSVDKLLMTTAEQGVLDVVRDLTWPDAETSDRDGAEWAAHWIYGRAASVYGGASDVQKDVIAERLLGLPR